MKDSTSAINVLTVPPFPPHAVRMCVSGTIHSAGDAEIVAESREAYVSGAENDWATAWEG